MRDSKRIKILAKASDILDTLAFFTRAEDLAHRVWEAKKDPKPFWDHGHPALTGFPLVDLAAALERGQRIVEELDAIYFATDPYKLPNGVPLTPKSEALWREVCNFHGFDDSE